MDEIFAPILHVKELWQRVEQKRKCIQRADLILSISETTSRDIIQFCPVDETKIVTVPLGVNPRFRPIDDQRKIEDFLKNHGLSQPVFLYVGNRWFHKNFTQVLRAFAKFKLRHEVTLLAVGGEPHVCRSHQEFIYSRGLSGSVKHIPLLDDEDLVLAYNTAQALISPSLYEGFGLPVLGSDGLWNACAGFICWLHSGGRGRCPIIF